MQRLQDSDAYWLADTNSSPVNTKERSRVYLLSGARCEPLSKECIAANSTLCTNLRSSCLGRRNCQLPASLMDRVLDSQHWYWFWLSVQYQYSLILNLKALCGNLCVYGIYTHIWTFHFWCSRKVCWGFGGVEHRRNCHTFGSLSSRKTIACFAPGRSWKK